MIVDPLVIGSAAVFITVVAFVVWRMRTMTPANHVTPPAPATPLTPATPILDVDSLDKLTKAADAARASVEALRATLGAKADV